MRIGYALSSEDHPPRDLLRAAQAAEGAGITDLWISDHYHPWIGAQGHSPFVWSVLGAIAGATRGVRIGTGVTCPTTRIHPAIVAQAAATTALLFEGRFFLGVGSGEALNEHILGDPWPEAEVRLAKLEEAVDVMRQLWTGEEVTHRGEHYRVVNARLYDAPAQPLPVYVSAFGPKAAHVAAAIGDGYIGTGPSPELVRAFRDAGGEGPAIAGAKCAWGPDEAECRRRIHQRWPNMGLPGELAQILPTPTHFEQAVQLVDEETAVGSVPVGPDPERYVQSLRTYADAGYDCVYVHHIGEDQEGFLRFLADEVVPAVAQPG